MLGGAKTGGDIAQMGDLEIKELVLNELSDIIGLKGEPDLVKIYRHERAMPQYNIGHLVILERLNALVSKYNGLYLHGNAYKGIGVNDCIENSYNLAERILYK
jgi:oxygen-dependent protoporphyrinogen oxidase